MSEALQQVLLFVSAWIIIVPLCMNTVYFKRLDIAHKLLGIHLWIACAVELTSYILMRQKRNNLPLLHFYTLSEFTLLYMYFDYYLRNTFPVWLLRSIAISFMGFTILNSLFIQSIYTFNSYARALEALLLILYSLLCFYRMAQSAGKESKPVIWVNAGILIYFSGAFTLFVLSNYILPLGVKLNVEIWAIHSFLSILLYTFIAIGLWKGRKQ